MRIKLDGEELEKFRILELWGEDCIEFTSDLSLGYSTHILKNSQFEELKKCGRLKII